MSFEEAKRFTAEMIAGLRVSREGQEGMAAFLEKESPDGPAEVSGHVYREELERNRPA